MNKFLLEDVLKSLPDDSLQQIALHLRQGCYPETSEEDWGMIETELLRRSKKGVNKLLGEYAVFSLEKFCKFHKDKS